MPIKNYTTDVPVERTINELHQILARAKAKAIMTHYDDDGFASGISFHIVIGERDMQFRLPVEVHGVIKAMERVNRRVKEAQARRIAWRIVKDWIDAQMALIESNQAELAQVFLPYAEAENGITFYQSLKQNGFLQLTHQAKQ